MYQLVQPSNMILKAAPRCARVARTARCLSVAPRFSHRAIHVKCQAQGPQEPHKQDDLQKRGRNEGEGLVSRRDDLLAPELSFRRMSDYIDSMQREMEAMFDLFGAPSPSVFHRSPLSSSLNLPSFLDTPTFSSVLRTTPFDVEEDEKEYRITADVPGFSKENIRVAVSHDGVLSIEGNVKEESGDEASGRRSRRVQNFVRRFRLPSHVNHDGISARVDHGVLSITLPKAGEAEAPSKEIPIN